MNEILTKLRQAAVADLEAFDAVLSQVCDDYLWQDDDSPEYEVAVTPIVAPLIELLVEVKKHALIETLNAFDLERTEGHWSPEMLELREQLGDILDPSLKRNAEWIESAIDSALAQAKASR